MSSTPEITRALDQLTPAARARITGWLELAARGWFMFPVRPGDKRPVIRGWEQRASTDRDQLARFYLAHPDCNAGIACGPSNLYVIDADTPKAPEDPAGGSEVLAELAADHGGLPDTWTVASPSGGRHHYYRRPAGSGLGNTAGVLGPLIDTRGSGGYVLAPGSWLAPVPARPGRVGSPDGSYELLDDTAPAELPGWIPQAIAQRWSTADTAAAEPVCAGGQWSRRYVERVVGQELLRVLSAGPGQHNHAVFTAARALGQLAAAGALDPGEAEALLGRTTAGIAAEPCDCTTRGLAATIRSGLACGGRRPRRLPDGARW